MFEARKLRMSFFWIWMRLSSVSYKERLRLNIFEGQALNAKLRTYLVLLMLFFLKKFCGWICLRMDGLFFYGHHWMLRGVFLEQAKNLKKRLLPSISLLLPNRHGIDVETASTPPSARAFYRAELTNARTKRMTATIPNKTLAISLGTISAIQPR